MIKHILLIICCFIVSCGGGTTNEQLPSDAVFTPLGILVKGVEIYTESERIDALATIDEYYLFSIECAGVSNSEQYPKSFTINVREPMLNDAGLEYFPCDSSETGKCSATINSKVITTVPGLPAVGHEFGHFWNRYLYGSTNHDPDDLSIICQPLFCHEYMVNHDNLFGCGGEV